MRGRTLLLLLAVWLALPFGLKAQKIRITRFERDFTGLEARMNPVYDNSGEACALINFWVRDKDYMIEPNLGVVKKEVAADCIKLWVPQGTKRIMVRHEGHLPLKGYNIPLRVEQKVTYDAYIEVDDTPQRTIGKNSVYVGAGYNVMQVMGPSVTVGVNLNHHNIELGGVYGLNKTDDLYFYDTSGNLTSGYRYNAVKARLSYGYELALADFFSVMPQVGGVYTAYLGSKVASTGSNSNYQNAYSIGVSGALRLALAFNKHLKLQITPEYDAAVQKDGTCKLLSKSDDKLKDWNTGFNLNVGLIVYF